ncbi:VRR-NUC domain-containing protein [Belnapia sp. T18]|uniref:VRR-NUC domain-containing protein n=1 Tax=Belnapia arida TaxID=2804533 RepID=A0ABS1UBV4_9PROT|nr:VRR-NUC domain-containing protein [Belnapia arida]MBL6082173.1 VRR-NUC domain-containing protein [Belnapia arida]
MNRTEQEMQIAIAHHLDWMAQLGRRFVWFAVPNGIPLGASSPVERRHAARIGGIFRAQGMKSGVPDIIIVAKSQILFVELKALSGRESAQQREWRTALTALGWSVTILVAADPGDAVEQIYHLLDQRRLLPDNVRIPANGGATNMHRSLKYNKNHDLN